MNYKQNITMIDELPELEDIDRKPYGNPIKERVENDKYDKYIRNSHKPLEESGMNNYNNMINNVVDDNIIESNIMESTTNDNFVQNKYSLPNGSPSCIDVANHIEVCPICSRYYKQDNSLYLLAILVLSIICVLLMKKVLK